MGTTDDRIASADAQLQRRVMHALAGEWEAALGLLSPTQRRSMRPPLFSLRDLKKRYGYWSGEKREICLDCGFALGHPWESVREVLLHEMAHQLTEEVLGGARDRPHGNVFRQACELLRANPQASGNFLPLNERVSGEHPEAGNKWMRRIRKLLALAESRNPHEAEAAMAKAHALLVKHNLDPGMPRQSPDFISTFVGTPALRHFREEYHMAHLLQDFYFVRGIWIPAYVIHKARMGRVLEISGRLPNVQMAIYVQAFVGRYIDSRWREYGGRQRLNRYRKSDFAVGILQGFRAKLEKQCTAAMSPQPVRALVRTGDAQLGEYMAWRYPRTVSVRGRPV
ncbi:MAG: SprT-like domain-containing protein, partial [Desulfobacterales bacterium]|nr:SprT-like domain-containing protein [Desulfobacterales bacterium]